MNSTSRCEISEYSSFPKHQEINCNKIVHIVKIEGNLLNDKPCIGMQKIKFEYLFRYAFWAMHNF